MKLPVRVEDGYRIVDADGLVICICGAKNSAASQARAAHIARCLNSHGKLVEVTRSTAAGGCRCFNESTKGSKCTICISRTILEGLPRDIP